MARLPMIDRYVAATQAGKPPHSHHFGATGRPTTASPKAFDPQAVSGTGLAVSPGLGWLLGRRFACLTHNPRQP